MPRVPATILPAIAALTTTANATEDPVAIPLWIELVAIVVASVSGVLTARERKLDLVGAVSLAVLCSLGGGALRDMLLQVGDVYILSQPAALPAAIITAAVVFIIPSLVAKQDRLIAVLDIFAVGLYAATGADKALIFGFNPLVCIMMGFFTAVGGGMLRDIFLGQTPYIFQRSNFYAVAAIAGAASYVAVAAAGLSHLLGVVVCVVVTMGLRFWSLHYNILSPTEVDLAKMVPHRPSRRRGDAGEAEGAAAPKPRLDRPDRTSSELAQRRERTLADIDRRREQERRSEALERIRRIRKKRDGRRLDI